MPFPYAIYSASNIQNFKYTVTCFPITLYSLRFMMHTKANLPTVSMELCFHENFFFQIYSLEKLTGEPADRIVYIHAMAVH